MAKIKWYKSLDWITFYIIATMVAIGFLIHIFTDPSIGIVLFLFFSIIPAIISMISVFAYDELSLKKKIKFIVLIIFIIGFFFYDDLGFQDDEEICNNPWNIGINSLELVEKLNFADGSKYVFIGNDRICSLGDWRDKNSTDIEQEEEFNYCKKNPEDKNRCVCEEERISDKIFGCFDTIDKVDDCIKARMEESKICIKARPISKEELKEREFERYKEENPDCFYYVKNQDDSFGCVIDNKKWGKK